MAFPLYEPRPSLGPSPGQVGTLTAGHLDELRDAEHTRGDEALLEVGRVWNKERMGVSGSVSLLDTMELGPPGLGPSLASDPIYTLQPCTGEPASYALQSTEGVPVPSHSRSGVLSILSESPFSGARWAPYLALPSPRDSHAAAGCKRAGPGFKSGLD